MRNLLAVIVLAGALTAAAGDAYGQTRRGDAVPFLSHVVRLIAANDYASAYPFLHPAQRRLINVVDYVNCEQLSPVPGKLSSLRVLRTTRGRIHVAGTSTGRVPTTAVTFELQLTRSLHRESATIHLTAHAVSVSGRSTWILSARRLALDRSGTCGIVADRAESYRGHRFMTEKLSTKDLDAALAVIRMASAADGSHPFEHPMLEQLTQLVPADQAGYFEYSVCEVDTHGPTTTRNVYLVEDPGAALDWQSEEIESALASWPLHDSHHVLTTTALRFSDAIPSRLQRLRNAYYAG